MSTHEAPTRGEGIVAYTLSALTTLLWVGCVLPAGQILDPTVGPDAATPVYRDAILIVPALLLLVIVPVGCTLAIRLHGMRAVLAGMDAFVALYVAIALMAVGFLDDAPALIAVATLCALGALALYEVIWHTGAGTTRDEESSFSGARLALALVMLILPLHILMHPDVERASLLAPFVFIALSAGGSRVARHLRGLRRTAAVLQLLVAIHLLVALRYTIFRTDPAIDSLYTSGEATLALASLVVFVALVQLLLYFRKCPEAGSGAEGSSTSDPRGAAPSDSGASESDTGDSDPSDSDPSDSDPSGADPRPTVTDAAP